MSEGADTGQATHFHREAFEPASGGDGGALGSTARRKRQAPACVVVVGEFNSGKTALVNALLGAEVLTPSFVTRTAHPTVVGFARRPSITGEIAGRRRIRLAWGCVDEPLPDDIRRLHVGVRLERLRTLRLIDTPGLGLDDEASDRRTLRACHSADAVIWCTPAMQAWKASEERAWLSLPRRVRDRGVLAVTFEDAIASHADAGRLLARLRADAGAHFRRIVLASEHNALLPPACEKGRASRGRAILARAARPLVAEQLG